MAKKSVRVTSGQRTFITLTRLAEMVNSLFRNEVRLHFAELDLLRKLSLSSPGRVTWCVQETCTQFMGSIPADLLRLLLALRIADKPQLQALHGNVLPTSQVMGGQARTLTIVAGTWPYKVA